MARSSDRQETTANEHTGVAVSNVYRSVQEIVFSTLKDQILSGELKPGDPLNTLELSERLGVSRTPIREALNRLEAVGLVTRERHRGMFVRSIPLDEMVNIYCIRAALFGIASRLATRRLTNEQKNRLAELCDQMETLLESHDHAEMLKKNAEFHALISEASNSEDLQILIDQYYHRSTQYRAFSFELAGRDREACREHRQILKALVAGDAEAAEQHSREHYFTTARRIAQSLGIEVDV